MDPGPDEPRAEAPPAGAVGPERRRRGRPLGVAVLVVLALAAWAAVCAVTLAQARRDALAGIDAVERAEGLTSPSELVDGAALGPLREAGDAFGRARRGLDSPAVLPLRVLPVVGRQVRSARALAGAADDIATIGTRAVEEARAALAQPRGTGPERVALLRRLGAAAARFEGELAAVDLGPGRALVDPLAERRAELADRLDEVRAAMGRGATVATGLAELLVGPRTYLVIGANNAEMRAGSGMFLSIGLLTFADGTMSLGGFRPAPELLLAEREPPIADPDLAARWGWMEPNREWRNLAATPRFAANAELAAAMWRAGEGEEVEGVVMVDPVALRGLLTSTGPVVAGDVTVSADNVLPLLLHDQYAGIDEGGDEAQAARREMLGVIAAATLAAVQGQEGDVGALATAFGEMAAGRHLMAWSRHPADQAVWEAAGVTGALTERSLSVAVLNRGGNKLDPFLDVDAALDVETSAAGGAGHAVELAVTMRNTVPEGENRYVAGGGHRGLEDLAPGDYRGLVSVNLPAFATEVEVEGDPALAAAGPDGPTTVVAWEIRIDRGQTATAVVRFRLPAELRRLTVEPSGRFPPVGWSAEGRSWESGPRHDVAW